MGDITFYYVYWDFGRNNHIRYSLNTLLLSIICAKTVYPESKIRIITYVKPSADMKKLADLCKAEIVFIEQAYVHKNRLEKCCSHSNGDCQFLLSKPMDCYEIAREMNDRNVALCDIDYFLFREFSEIDFGKVGILYGTETKPPPRVNTGLILFGTHEFNSRFFFKLYGQMLEIFNHEKVSVEDSIKVPVYGSSQSLQEEICISLIVRKYFELNDTIFYDLTKKNHVLYESMKKLDYSRNIHTARLDKARIVPVLLGSRKIRNFVASFGQNNIVEIFKPHLQQKFSQEELFLQSLLDSQLPELKIAGNIVKFTKNRKIFM